MEEKEEDRRSKSHLEPGMKDVAQVILEEIAREEDRGDEVEIYAHELRSQFYQDGEKFQSRFVRGYDSLLEMLGRQ